MSQVNDQFCNHIIRCAAAGRAHLTEEKSKSVNWTPHDGELDKVLEEDAADRVLGAYGRGPALWEG